MVSDEEMDNIYDALITIKEALDIVAVELKTFPRTRLERKLEELEGFLES